MADVTFAASPLPIAAPPPHLAPDTAPGALAPVDSPLARALDQLITRREFDIHFQPIVDSARVQVLGYEALVRPPSHSPLASPPVLFQVAAELGRLVELERHVVRRIVRKFVELRLPGRVFINVSADTLISARARHPLSLPELARCGLPAADIVVELTETRAVLDEAALANVVASLRASGLSFALDDLGQGFASLKRWLDLRPDFVKIDRHFVDGVAADPLRRQFVRSILEMARSSGAAVIAEGLEQADDWCALRDLGIDLFQGYLFARPSPAPRLDLPLEPLRRG